VGYKSETSYAIRASSQLSFLTTVASRRGDLKFSTTLCDNIFEGSQNFPELLR
jgi:hypothetical protein